MSTNSPDSFEKLKSKINDRLEKVKQEIEELSVQFNLGKAEASDKFENVKKDFFSKINEWKITGEQMFSAGKIKTQGLKTKLEELEVQLSLGKTEAKDLFNEQKKKIMSKISEIEAEIKGKAGKE